MDDVTLTYVNEGALSTLRQVDNIVYKVMCGLKLDGTPHPGLKNVLNSVQQVLNNFNLVAENLF